MAETVALHGVPETLLWPLYNRAAFASRPGALLEDPKSVEIRNAIDYPFERVSRNSRIICPRAKRSFLERVRKSASVSVKIRLCACCT